MTAVTDIYQNHQRVETCIEWNVKGTIHRQDIYDDCTDMNSNWIKLSLQEQKSRSVQSLHECVSKAFYATGRPKRLRVQSANAYLPSRQVLLQVFTVFAVLLCDYVVQGDRIDYNDYYTISAQIRTHNQQVMKHLRQRTLVTDTSSASTVLVQVLNNKKKMMKLESKVKKIQKRMRRRQQVIKKKDGETNGMQQMNHPKPIPIPVLSPQVVVDDNDDFSIINIIATQSDVPTTSPTISNVPSVQPTRTSVPSRSVSLGSNRPTNFPTQQPSRSPTVVPSNIPSYQPSSIPSMKPSTYPTSFPSVVPSVQPSSEPTTKRNHTKMTLSNFTIQLRTEAGSPAVNASSVSSILSLYMETEMLFANLLSIRLNPTNEFTVVLSGFRGNDIAVTDIDFNNNIAIFSGVDTQVSGLLNEQNFVLRDTMGIQKYFDRAVESTLLGNDNVTVVACFFEKNATDTSNTTNTSSSLPTEDVNQNKPMQNKKAQQPSSISGFLRSPLGVWAIVAISLSIAAFLFVLGVAIIKATQARHESTKLIPAREIDINVTANQDDDDDDDDDFDDENFGVIPLKNGNYNEGSDDDDVDTNDDVNRNKNTVDRRLQSMITVCKTETSTKKPSSTSMDDTDFDNIDYEFSFDLDGSDDDNDNDSYSPMNLGLVAASAHHKLFDPDEINSISSSSTACDVDTDGIDKNGKTNHYIPNKQTTTMQNLMVKRNLLPPMNTADTTSTTTTRASSDHHPPIQQQHTKTATTNTQSANNAVAEPSILPPRPKTSASSYFRQKLQFPQRKQQQQHQQNTQHQIDHQQSPPPTGTKAWRQDTTSVSELSNDEHDFKYDEYDDNSYSTSDIYTTAGTK